MHLRIPSRPGVLLAVFFLSASLLALEVLFVRLVSILLYPVSTYLVISLALLGYGLSGTLLALRRSRDPVSPRQASTASIAFGVTTLLALADIWFAGQSPVAAALLPVALGLPFACGGRAIALALSLPDIPVNQVYFADLLGAGLGAVTILLGLQLLGGIRLGAMLAGSGLVAAGLFGLDRENRRGWILSLAGIATIILAGLVPIPVGILPIAPKELGSFKKLGPQVVWDYQGWHPLARVDVLTLPGDKVELPQAFDYKLVTQDGGAPSILLNIPDIESADFTDHTIFGVPYWIKTEPKVLIIGLGGGPDVQAALHSGASSITGVEINPQMVELVRGPFAEFTGRPYEDPRVKIIEGDGRHIIRLVDEAYDIIQLTGVDTSVASVGANPNLAENYLYTVEAFREFYQRLAPDGLLSVSFPATPGLGLRLTALSVTALQAEGIADPGQQLIVSTTGGFAHVLTKRSPFTDEEIEVIEEHYGAPMIGLYFPLYSRLFNNPSADFFAANEVLYAPHRDYPGLYSDYLRALEAGQGNEYLAAQTWTVLPPTDDWPFFFVLDKWGEHAPNLQILMVTLGLLFAAALAFILTPAMILHRRGLQIPHAWLLMLYFTALGLGYIFIEVVFIQKLSLFLGHPSYALATTLCTLLISSGIGSLVSKRSWVPAAAVGVAILTLVAAIAAGRLFNLLLPLPLAARVLIAAGIVALPGFLMGMPFPNTLEAVKAKAPAFVPWAWAINSTATVIGTITSVLLAMLWGFTVVFLCAGMLYLLAAWTGSVILRPG
jgi:SAM-dependent methyltransferase